MSSDGRWLTSTDLSQPYVTARRLAAPVTPAAAPQKDCCQETHGCEVKRIDAEFERTLASCRQARDAACTRAAVSTKAAQLKAAGEQLRACQRAGATTPVSAGAAPSGRGTSTATGNDEFHSTDPTGCGPCGPGGAPPPGGPGGTPPGPAPGPGPRPEPTLRWPKAVKVEGEPEFQAQVERCFREFENAAQKRHPLAKVVRAALQGLSESPHTVTIEASKALLPGDNETSAVGPHEGGCDEQDVHGDVARGPRRGRRPAPLPA
jgi:hypothetical protein